MNLLVVTDSIQSGTIGMPVFENMGVAAVISFLSSIEVEILHYFISTSGLIVQYSY